MRLVKALLGALRFFPLVVVRVVVVPHNWGRIGAKAVPLLKAEGKNPWVSRLPATKVFRS